MAANEKSTRKKDFRAAPSVGEAVETCSWLSEALRKDLEADMEGDGGSVLRNADIE